MSKTRHELLTELSEIIVNYRQDDEIAPRTPELIDRWLRQFPEDDQGPFLAALVDVLRKTYISKDDFMGFLRGLAVSHEVSAGMDQREFWRTANFLDIQQGGASQGDILALFDQVLRETYGFGTDEPQANSDTYIYLDDCVATGSRVKNDICQWIQTDAPANCLIHVITAVRYEGSYWIDAKINEAAQAAGKVVRIKPWWIAGFHIENRRFKRDQSDILWPTEIPDAPACQRYAEALVAKERAHEPRTPECFSGTTVFSDESQRGLIERVLLTRGCQIREEQANLPDKARPLGYHNLDCLGFGSMFVFYRNCPNNCPLALWVDQHEYPALFPRRTNNATRLDRLMAL